MSKIFVKLFPFLDYAYIYQLFEYESVPYLLWFSHHPLSRNLQRKHTIVYTQKMQLLLTAAFGIMLVLATILVIGITWQRPISVPATIFGIGLVTFLLQQIAPVFFVLAHFLTLPVELVQRRSILKAAAGKRSQLPNLIVVGICGSYGKTSVKDMLYTLLWHDFYVVKTPKSYNTPVSVAKTMLSELKATTQVFIAEMDAYHPGEITELAKLVQPTYGLITTIAPQHLERFGSMEALATTQFELANTLPENGVLFLNGDDAWQNKLQHTIRNKKVFFGSGANADVYADSISHSQKGITFLLHTKNDTKEISLPLLGHHHAHNFAAAAGVALALGLSLDTIAKRAAYIQPTPHRMELKQVGSFTVIDNTYNTNPAASQASLALLQQFTNQEHVVVTPGYIELGTEEQSANTDLGKKVAAVAQFVVIVGDHGKAAILDGLLTAGFSKEHIAFAPSAQASMELLQKSVQKNAIILLENDLPDQYF